LKDKFGPSSTAYLLIDSMLVGRTLPYHIL